jgi:hypothetical protein
VDYLGSFFDSRMTAAISRDTNVLATGQSEPRSMPYCVQVPERDTPHDLAALSKVCKGSIYRRYSFFWNVAASTFLHPEECEHRSRLLPLHQPQSRPEELCIQHLLSGIELGHPSFIGRHRIPLGLGSRSHLSGSSSLSRAVFTFALVRYARLIGSRN